jgi:hypothetical protein
MFAVVRQVYHIEWKVLSTQLQANHQEIRRITMPKSLQCAVVLLTFCIPFASAQAVAGDTRPAEYAMADKELNKTYTALMNRLRKEDKESLKKAQRIWISLREADCKWVSPAEPLDCMIERTEHRTTELKASIFEAANGEYTSLEMRK